MSLARSPAMLLDVEQAVRVIERPAITNGVNWLDTSENYLATNNESVIGQALDRIGDEFLVASKVAPRAGVTGGASGFRRKQVVQACRDSLMRLGREHNDIYFLHWPGRTRRCRWRNLWQRDGGTRRRWPRPRDRPLQLQSDRRPSKSATFQRPWLRRPPSY